MPTQIGDVIILRTADATFSTHAVGQVFKDGQQDLGGQTSVRYVKDRAAAVAEATALVVPGRRIFFRNLDTGEWSEMAR